MKIMSRLCRSLLPFAGFAATLSLAALPLSAAGPQPTVVELFTSQGCSSCPPADAALKSLSEQPDLIALTWAVDYWDRLGWRDTYADPSHAVRQTAYNKRLGRGGVYTPQMIFDGVSECVGSDRTKVRDHIDEVRATREAFIPVGLGIDGASLVVSLPDQATDQEIAVRLVWYQGNAEVVVGDGENAGRTLHYTNVVRASEVVKDWDGKALRLDLGLDAATANGADHAAVLLHKGYGHGPIVGAAHIDLRPALKSAP